MLVGWHIEQGRFGEVALDRLNVAMAAYSPGHMQQVKWQAALYLDEKASDTPIPPNQENGLITAIIIRMIAVKKSGINLSGNFDFLNFKSIKTIIPSITIMLANKIGKGISNGSIR